MPVVSSGFDWNRGARIDAAGSLALLGRGSGSGLAGSPAADCGGCLGTGARWLFELDDRGVDAGVAQELRGAQRGGVPGRPHGPKKRESCDRNVKA